MTKSQKNPGNTYDTSKRWLDWNILFTPNSNDDQRKKALAGIKEYIQKEVDKESGPRKKNFIIKYETNFCSCDPLLTNLRADPQLLDSTGDSRTPVPVKTPRGSGDVVQVISNNQSIGIPGKEFLVIPSSPFTIRSNNVDDKLLVAIIDTGIDTTLFTPNISGLLWNGAGASSQRNFIDPGNPNDFSDHHPIRHGSSATAIALHEFQGRFPRLMILKAFDNSAIGSIFSVSCAIAFAVKNHANLINASWGYYGSTPDPLLAQYVGLSNQNVIPIIAAAGNAEGEHDAELCRPVINPVNELKGDHLFYPACFSAEMKNIIAVTGLSQPNIPCYFQNYSPKLVTIGVINDSLNCCQFKLPFLRLPIEGSSFSTPVVTGKIGQFIFQNGFQSDTHVYIEGIKQTTGLLPLVTVNGQFARE